MRASAWSPVNEAVNVALSGLCGASVRGCQISTVHTTALCAARGCISMGPLMDHSRLFIVHLATEDGARRGLYCTTPGRYTKPRAQLITKATLSSVYWKLISSPASFCIHKTQDGERTGWSGQSQEGLSFNDSGEGHWNYYLMLCL